ncbi:MAG: CrcB family protein, partial [Sediminibacterium sp.]|nr:CrcB family protein [Sediminibacterium sp.]
MFLQQLLWVGLGGMIGTMLRYIAGIAIRNTQFPLATLVVNILGSFLIGLFMGWYSRQA